MARRGRNARELEAEYEEHPDRIAFTMTAEADASPGASTGVPGEGDVAGKHEEEEEEVVVVETTEEEEEEEGEQEERTRLATSSRGPRARKAPRPLRQRGTGHARAHTNDTRGGVTRRQLASSSSSSSASSSYSSVAATRARNRQLPARYDDSRSSAHQSLAEQQRQQQHAIYIDPGTSTINLGYYDRDGRWECTTFDSTFLLEEEEFVDLFRDEGTCAVLRQFQTALQRCNGDVSRMGEKFFNLQSFCDEGKRQLRDLVEQMAGLFTPMSLGGNGPVPSQRHAGHSCIRSCKLLTNLMTAQRAQAARKLVDGLQGDTHCNVEACVTVRPLCNLDRELTEDEDGGDGLYISLLNVSTLRRQAERGDGDGDGDGSGDDNDHDVLVPFFLFWGASILRCLRKAGFNLGDEPSSRPIVHMVMSNNDDGLLVWLEMLFRILDMSEAQRRVLPEALCAAYSVPCQQVGEEPRARCILSMDAGGHDTKGCLIQRTASDKDVLLHTLGTAFGAFDAVDFCAARDILGSRAARRSFTTALRTAQQSKIINGVCCHAPDEATASDNLLARLERQTMALLDSRLPRFDYAREVAGAIQDMFIEDREFLTRVDRAAQELLYRAVRGSGDDGTTPSSLDANDVTVMSDVIPDGLCEELATRAAEQGSATDADFVRAQFHVLKRQLEYVGMLFQVMVMMLVQRRKGVAESQEVHVVVTGRFLAGTPFYAVLHRMLLVAMKQYLHVELPVLFHTCPPHATIEGARALHWKMLENGAPNVRLCCMQPPILFAVEYGGNVPPCLNHMQAICMPAAKPGGHFDLEVRIAVVCEQDCDSDGDGNGDGHGDGNNENRRLQFLWGDDDSMSTSVSVYTPMSLSPATQVCHLRDGTLDNHYLRMIQFPTDTPVEYVCLQDDRDDGEEFNVLQNVDYCADVSVTEMLQEECLEHKKHPQTLIKKCGKMKYSDRLGPVACLTLRVSWDSQFLTMALLGHPGKKGSLRPIGQRQVHLQTLLAGMVHREATTHVSHAGKLLPARISTEIEFVQPPQLLSDWLANAREVQAACRPSRTRGGASARLFEAPANPAPCTRTGPAANTRPRRRPTDRLNVRSATEGPRKKKRRRANNGRRDDRFPSGPASATTTATASAAARPAAVGPAALGPAALGCAVTSAMAPRAAVAGSTEANAITVAPPTPAAAAIASRGSPAAFPARPSAATTRTESSDSLIPQAVAGAQMTTASTTRAGR